VGAEEEIETIIGEFKTFCFENGWSLGFHQTLPDFLPVYKKLGFRRLKIGDDAVVDLVRFDLEGREKKDLRHKVNQLEKDGYRYVRYDPPLLDSVLRQAEEVSREWLKIPGRRERGFSLGMFELEYIRFTPLLAAVDKNGIIQAFVNIIPSYCGEATIDLMRHSLSAPKGIMEYLFVKNILYFKEQGFKRFNMGMAPMSGFQDREEATMEERAIHYFFQRLNFMFSYTGLKQFKAKFATIWEPRYAIYQNTLDLPRHALALTRVSEIS
jgi:phosphatidylglycerol lysyltransferase